MKVYAYVKYESFTSCGAVFPGSFIGLYSEPVSRHRDWSPWMVGKRETLSIIALGCSSASQDQYSRYHCARLVAELLGWA